MRNTMLKGTGSCEMDRIVTDCYCSNRHNRFEGATVTLIDTYHSNTGH